MKKKLIIAVLLVLTGLTTYKIAKAQVPNNPWQVGVSSATHTSCTLVAGSTQFCFASDGAWVSVNGAAYVQVGGTTAGVISFNGRTGAVVPVASDYPAPVLSVNGKTGTVVLGATATAPTVSVQ